MITIYGNVKHPPIFTYLESNLPKALTRFTSTFDLGKSNMQTIETIARDLSSKLCCAGTRSYKPYVEFRCNDMNVPNDHFQVGHFQADSVKKQSSEALVL